MTLWGQVTLPVEAPSVQGARTKRVHRGTIACGMVLRDSSAILGHIVQTIVTLLRVEKIILFGSYASGCPKSDSDIDLLVVLPEGSSKLEAYLKIRRALKSFEVPLDILVLTSGEFAFYAEEWKNSVVFEAKERGIILYETKRV